MCRTWSLIFLSSTVLCYSPPGNSGWGYPAHVDFLSVLSQNESGHYHPEDNVNSFDSSGKMFFDHVAVLSDSGKVKLFWKFDRNNISLQFVAPSTGWIAFGIAREQHSDVGADVIVTGISGQNHYVIDMHINQNGEFEKDKSQDVTPKQVWHIDDSTHAWVYRSLVTCDRAGDVEITSDTLRIIWAYGKNTIDDPEQFREKITDHESGSLHLKLLNPPTIKFSEAGIRTRPKTKILEVRSNDITVSKGRPRHCKAFRFQNLIKKNQIVEFEPAIQEGNEFNVRQIAIIECAGIFKELMHDDQHSVDCETVRQIANCSTVVLVWAFSMKHFAFPDDAGYPIFPNGAHFVMEIQYQNEKTANLRDSSGMKIHYSEKLRPHDTGVLTTGSLAHHSQLIPPRSSNFRLQGHCMEECIRMSIPENAPVRIFTATLHAREAGRRIRVRHFRKGQELTPVVVDNGFRSHHIETYYVSTELQLKKGDNMIVECSYDTSNRTEITFVNNSMGGESCLAYLGYYPRIAKLTACETAPTEYVTMETVGANRPEEEKALSLIHI